MSRAPIATARPLRVALEGELPPAGVAALVRGDRDPVLLSGRWAAGSTLVASEPLARADGLAALDAQPALDGPAPPGFVGGGWFGLLGYGLGATLEALAPPPPAPDRLPRCVLAFHDHLLRRDAEGAWWFEALWTAARAEALDARLEVLRARLAAATRDAQDAREAPRAAAGPWTATPSPAGHARAVAACRERIAAGDLFQANLALRLSAPFAGDPAALFARGVAALAPDRAAFLAGDWGAVASLSPELFLARHGDVVRSAPIKGTRPRGEDPAALAASEKDRAENIMIVDLVRNDLGRVCVPGSVVVGALAEPRPHAGVWHLVSEVTGQARPGTTHADLLAATFPPGSVTGAPKVAAMDVISALESAARQAFCGAIGFASPAAGLELSVAIRTFEVRGGRAWLDVGGGVVHDSDPAGEAREAFAKAAPLLRALGAEPPPDAPQRTGPGAGAAPVGRGLGPRARGAGSDPAPPPLRLGARPVPRPDPAAGIFETVLVRDGVPQRLGAHLERLAASARALGLPEPDPVLPALHGDGRLRLLHDARGTRAEQASLPAATAPTTLRAVTVPGGLGPHKWQDRRLLDALARATAPDVPLLVDLDGFVLEASRANLLVLTHAGERVTPPLDGRILQGTARARAVAELGVTERPVHLAEVHAAALTGALRGVEPVAALDGRPLGSFSPGPARRPAAAGTR